MQQRLKVVSLKVFCHTPAPVPPRYTRNVFTGVVVKHSLKQVLHSMPWGQCLLLAALSCLCIVFAAPVTEVTSVVQLRLHTSNAASTTSALRTRRIPFDSQLYSNSSGVFNPAAAWTDKGWLIVFRYDKVRCTASELHLCNAQVLWTG